MNLPNTVIPLKTIPTCLSIGALSLFPHQQRIAAQLKADLLAQGGYVEKQVICTAPLYTDMAQLNYAVTDYAAILTLRQHGLTVAAISSGTLLCCPERHQLIVQRRSATAASYPHKLGPFGGHYCPDRQSLGYGMLLDTLIDELRDESGCDLLQLGMNLPTDLPPMFFIVEPSTGSIQFTPLAFALTPEQADQLHGSYEGELETYHLVDDLDILMHPKQWSGVGYTSFLTWRSLGFPVQKSWQGRLIESQDYPLVT